MGKSFAFYYNVAYNGWYVFPRPVQKARSLTFFDDSRKLIIPGISLDPESLIGIEARMVFYPLVWYYARANWTTTISQEGGLLMTHRKIANCLVQEWTPSQPVGKYKNNIEINGVTYDLYSWSEPDKGWSVREYVALKGFGSATLEIPPLFRATIPSDNANLCANEVATLLGSLKAVNP